MGVVVDVVDQYVGAAVRIEKPFESTSSAGISVVNVELHDAITSRTNAWPAALYFF